MPSSFDLIGFLKERHIKNTKIGNLCISVSILQARAVCSVDAEIH